MSDAKSRVLDNIKEIRALNDPYRQEILSWMTLIGKPSTSKEIATAMKEAPSKVNYHLKVLEKYNFVEIDHTENINGIIAKYYKRTVTNFDFNLHDDESKSKEVAVISMLESLFNNARERHIGRVREVLKYSDDEREEDKGLLSSTKLYLNKEEVTEFKNLIKKHLDNDKENRELYNVFVSFIKDE